jgi:LPS O-antigen subunit length determinant protein (WzzB/FepE family)
MIVALTALVFAVVALGLTIVSNKKKAVPATVAETEDEE